MQKKLTLREWLEAYENNEFTFGNFDTMVKAGWYDWFSDDHMLVPMLDAMAPHVKLIAQSKKVDIDNMCVWFKEICPSSGPTFGMFGIRAIDGDLSKGAWNIVPISDRGNSELWGTVDPEALPKVKGTGPLIEGPMEEIYDYFEV